MSDTKQQQNNDEYFVSMSRFQWPGGLECQDSHPLICFTNSFQ